MFSVSSSEHHPLLRVARSSGPPVYSTFQTPDEKLRPFPKSKIKQLAVKTRHFLFSFSFLFFLLACCFSSFDQVSRKILTANAYNYRWAIVFAANGIAFIVSSLLVIWNFSAVRSSFVGRRIPWKSLLFVAFLDSGHAVGLAFSVGILTPAQSLLVPQIILPVTILFQFFRNNGATCRLSTALGCLLVVSGVFLSFAPSLLAFQPCLTPLSRDEAAALADSGLLESNVFTSRSRSELLFNILFCIFSLTLAGAASVSKQSLLSLEIIHFHFFHWISTLLIMILLIGFSPFLFPLQYLGNHHAQIPVEIISNSDAAQVKEILHYQQFKRNQWKEKLNTGEDEKAGKWGDFRVNFADSSISSENSDFADSPDSLAPPDDEKPVIETDENSPAEDSSPSVPDSFVPPASSQPEFSPPSSSIGDSSSDRSSGEYEMDSAAGPSWSDRVTHNFMTNLYFASLCLFGINSQFGDQCQLEGFPPYTMLAIFMVYSLATLFLHLSLHGIMAKSRSAADLSLPFVFALPLAFAILYSPSVSALLPRFDGATCLDFSWSLCLGFLLVFCGLLWCWAGDYQSAKEVRPWNLLEELENLEALDELEYERARRRRREMREKQQQPEQLYQNMKNRRKGIQQK